MGNFVIVDVESQRKDYPDMTDPRQAAEVNARLLTIAEYRTLACRIINKFAPTSARIAMLDSEDAIDFVAHHIMLADWDYQQGRAGIQTYRGYCGKMAIQCYIEALNKQNVFRRDEDGRERSGRVVNNFFQHNDIVAVNEDITVRNEEREEIRGFLNVILRSLNTTQRACLVMRYTEDMRDADIAKELGISREGVRRSIQDGMRRLRKVAGVKT